MRFAFIHQHRGHQPGWTTERLCGILQVSRSGFYEHLATAAGTASDRLKRIAEAIRRLFVEHRGRYGSPRIHQSLLHEGITCDRKTVAKVMKQEGLAARRRRKFRPGTTDSRHDLPIALDRLRQDFTTERPNQAWVTDLTYVPTAEGWLYVVTVLDLFSRRIVGHACGDHMRASLCVEALEKATASRGRHEGLIIHSDRGVQFASDEFAGACQRHGLVRSMSRKGNCYDNAVAESFFKTLKTEHLDGRDFGSRREAQLEIFAFIEGYYNTRRMHSTLGYLSPNDFEQQAATVAA